MKTNIVKRICPLCQNEYTGYPAISRKDGCTEICPDCGTRESLEVLGVSSEEIENIINTIHRSTEE